MATSWVRGETMPTGLLPATIPFKRYQPSRRTTTFGSLRDPIGPPMADFAQNKP